MKHARQSWLPSSGIPVLLALLVSLSCGGGGTVEEPTGLPKGAHPIIVIAVDGLRADYLGCYGGTEVATPAFDALAAEAVRFEWAFAQAPTPAVSFAALASGLYPTASGVRASGDRLPEEAVTLAEAASAGGMVTAGFMEGAPGGDDFGLGQGFTTFEMGPEPGAAAAEWLGLHASGNMLLVLRGWSVGLDFGPDTTVEGMTAPDGFFERFQQVLASDFSDQPLPMEPQDLEYVKALYTARIKAADVALGELMVDLADLDLLDRTTLVLTGTTGLDLEQHGPTGSVSLHATVARVPLFIRLPGGQYAQVVDEIVELIDVMPTILDLAGAEVPSGVQGASLAPIIEGTGRPPYIAFGESTALGSQRAVALGGLRMVSSKDIGTAALYDLGADPLEMNDISEQQGDRVAVLQRHLEAWEKMVTAVSLDPELRSEEELDDATLEQLKSLGYIQ